MTESSMVWRDSLPGRLIGERYLVEKRIAEGAAGYVFRAFDQQHERLVAVKVLKADAAFHEQIRKRFVNEVRTTMTIDSPHVVQIFDVGELEDGSPFYAMEFLEGVTLDEYRVDTLEMVKRIAIQICRGLAAAHEKGVVHRDLKPENILVTEDEDGLPHCHLVDFGVAKLPFATLKTMPGQVLGTPAYLAPEQAKADADIDHRCDIYALGVLLYELVSGTLPFEDDDPIRLALLHLTAPPLHLLDLEPSCPPALAALIMRCLEKEPRDRYPDVATVAIELSGTRLRGILGAPSAPTMVPRSSARVRITPPEPQPWLPRPTTEAALTQMAPPPFAPPQWTAWLALGVAAAFIAAVATLTV